MPASGMEGGSRVRGTWGPTRWVRQGFCPRDPRGELVDEKSVFFEVITFLVIYNGNCRRLI